MPRVIHLRLGDAVCGNTSAMRQRRPHSAHDTIATIRRLNSTDGAILWGSHNEMCIDASLKYVKHVSEMTGWQILEGSADEHLCLMIKAKLFIAGVGSYSQLAVELRNASGLPSLMELTEMRAKSSSSAHDEPRARPSSSTSAHDEPRHGHWHYPSRNGGGRSRSGGRSDRRRWDASPRGGDAMTEMMKTTKTTKQQDSGLEGGRGGGGSDTLDVKKQINPATSSPDAAFVVDAEIEAYLEKLQTRLHDVTICSDDDVAPQGGGGPCPVWWLQIEARWRLRFIAAEQLMILRHAKRFGGEFLPTSNRPIGKLAKHLAQLKPLVSLFDYWEPLFSCSDEERVPSDVLGDGPKWLCGPSQHRRLPDNGGSGNEAAAATEVRQPPCRVFSGGSNFDDGLERGMFDLAGCEAYIIDPTLMPGERLTAFEARLARCVFFARDTKLSCAVLTGT